MLRQELATLGEGKGASPSQLRLTSKLANLRISPLKGRELKRQLLVVSYYSGSPAQAGAQSALQLALPIYALAPGLRRGTIRSLARSGGREALYRRDGTRRQLRRFYRGMTMMRGLEAALLVAILRKRTKRPPGGKPGRPKVGRGHCWRARDSATLQTAQGVRAGISLSCQAWTNAGGRNRAAINRCG